MNNLNEMETIIFGILSNGGNAKGLAYEAITCSEEGNFKQAENLLKEADKYLLEAHKIQTSIIQKEASGEKSEVSVLFVHAQDHLMSALEIKTLAEKFININKRLEKLENKF